MGFIVGLVLGALLAFLGLFGSFAAYEGAGESSAYSCYISDEGWERCTPQMVNGEYQLPESGSVIEAIVNAGPLPPEYQNGYSIKIDATGHVGYTVTTEGEDTEYSGEIGIDGMQVLLSELEGSGYYFLPRAEEFDGEDMPVGGSVSVLSVNLLGGAWSVDGKTLMEASEQDSLSLAQSIVERAVSRVIPIAAPATPVAH